MLLNAVMKMLNKLYLSGVRWGGREKEWEEMREGKLWYDVK